MNEYQLLDLEEQENDLGRVEISPEVIEVIAGLAAAEIEGVSALRGNFANDVAERFGKKNHGKGVKVELGENGVTIEVSVVAYYGVSVPEIGMQVQKNIQQALETMTAISLDGIHVHVVGIHFEKEEETTLELASAERLSE
ncbi:Asp23/Gls24 family envelope stress response protein [Geomicrobium sp. JCM 19039]|uniref:Asp23/Gls24 family envelope stress response protein n=1 Tax=Geomicrobium sp. JCM 19039 TaxID=1460636 RepID=UPI00045F33A9|nr:Asp23/Gls24 family envelope stress response protein [Geomicrobium sp. JCM 19039]GAK12802.1 alkaline shock protein [Geomicrobium sp. JCM 19039]